jgi:hypothetical protein
MRPVIANLRESKGRHPRKHLVRKDLARSIHYQNFAVAMRFA